MLSAKQIAHYRNFDLPTHFRGVTSSVKQWCHVRTWSMKMVPSEIVAVKDLIDQCHIARFTTNVVEQGANANQLPAIE